MRICEIVPDHMFGCRQHWFMVPKDIRDEVWRTWQARLAGGPAQPHQVAKLRAQHAVEMKLAGGLR